MKKINVTKKIVLGLFLMLLTVATSCEKESISSNSNEQFDKTTLLRNQGEAVVISLAGGSGHRGLAGPGIYVPGVTVPFNDCHNPNGICMYADVFGGQGEIDVWKAHLISDNTVRLEFLNSNEVNVAELTDKLQAEITNGDIWINDPTGQSSGNNIDANELANFIATHYNIPNTIVFDATISKKLLSKSDVIMQTVPGDYEIIVDDAHPNGYFDMLFTIEPN
jgi:hypothetical protein